MFAYRLAAHVAHTTNVDAMLASMTTKEFGEWMAYYRIEPFGPIRADLQAGMVAATLHNLHRKKGSRAARPGDYIMTFRKRQQTPQQQYDIFKAFFAAHGNGDNRKH